MFWKKKKSDGEGTSKLFKAPQETRGAFRISPDPAEPVLVKMNGTTATVVDISSGGVSLKCKSLKIGSLYEGIVTLPRSTKTITLKLNVLRQDETQAYHCRFMDLTPEHEDEIHRYVFLRQKEELQNRKNKYIS